MPDRELLRLGREAWGTFAAAAGLEWWLGNGVGGWASGSVAWANSRYYHGLLAAALHPPVERTMLLAKVDDTLEVAGHAHPLFCNQWAGGQVEAAGLGYLLDFSLAPFPVYTYSAGGWLVTRTIFPVYGHNATVIRWSLRPGPGAPPSAVLRLRPWVTCRTVHGVIRRNDWPFLQEVGGSAACIRAFAGAPPLHLRADGGAYHPAGAWLLNVYYAAEAARGEDTTEDLHVPGEFRFTARGASEFTLLAATDPLPHGLPAVVAPLAAGWGEGRQQAEAARAGALLDRFQDPLARTLAWAAAQFVCRRASTGTATVLAGFPWFTDWGRDTMISLPGLALTTGRPDLARELLLTFARHLQDGLVPNTFPDEGSPPLYNTADATLWYFQALWRYWQATGDGDLVLEDLYPLLREVVRHHLQGTRHGIGTTREWLLRCGGPDVQVTWMDAKVGDWVVTPRDGLPVEIQALWHNALRIMARLAEAAGDRPDQYFTMAEQVQAAFMRRFWHRAGGYLYDRVADDGTPDPAIRPNQVLAVSLDHPLVGADVARKVVATVWRELWTPYGLRSLAPGEPQYHGRYTGSRRERDGAYHQGTAWAWLVGPFITAYLKAYGRGPGQLAMARELLRPLAAHVREAGLGSVAEIFDGDAPHLPRGCPAQAWSVAELLRVWIDELGHR